MEAVVRFRKEMFRRGAPPPICVQLGSHAAAVEAAALAGPSEPDNDELALPSRPLHRLKLSANATAENARGIAGFARTMSHPRSLTYPHLLLPRLQELQTVAQAGASGSEAVAPAGLAQPKGVGEFRRKKREGPQRRMVDHQLPPYVEANFRSLHFMMVRFPKVSDFPREKCAPPCPPALPPSAPHAPPAGVLTRRATSRLRVSARCPPVGTQLGGPGAVFRSSS